MTIDYLRMITDPLASYWRIEKSLKRMVLLQKHYPLPKVDKPIQIINSEPILDKAVNTITQFLSTSKKILILELRDRFNKNEKKIVSSSVGKFSVIRL